MSSSSTLLSSGGDTAPGSPHQLTQLGIKSFCAEPEQFLADWRTPVLAKTLFLLLARGRWSLGSILPAPLSPQALRAAGWSVSLLDLAGVDHFDIIERLSEDSYILTQVGRRAVPGWIRWAATSLRGGAGSGVFTGFGSSSQVILNMIGRA